MNPATFETFCPCFPGFYNTVFDESDSWLEMELSGEETFRERYPELNAVPFDYITSNFWDCIDWNAARLEQCKAIVASLAEFLPGVVQSAEFQKINSPREYNFYNDSIDCKITVDLDRLHDVILENETAFTGFLRERYTSRSGFFSSYSNEPDDWRDLTSGYTELAGHYCGALLEFAAQIEHGKDANGCAFELYQTGNHGEAFSNAVNPDTAKLIADWEASAKS